MLLCFREDPRGRVEPRLLQPLPEGPVLPAGPVGGTCTSWPKSSRGPTGELPGVSLQSPWSARQLGLCCHPVSLGCQVDGGGAAGPGQGCWALSRGEGWAPPGCGRFTGTTEPLNSGSPFSQHFSFLVKPGEENPQRQPSRWETPNRSRGRQCED